MTFEEYQAELERIRRERDAVLVPLDEQIDRLTEQLRQTSAVWNAQIRELDQQYIAAAPYKVGDIVKAKSMAGLTEVYKIVVVGRCSGVARFWYSGVPKLKSGGWAQREQILGDIKSVESTEGK